MVPAITIAHYHLPQPLALEQGGQLPGVRLRYMQWGTPAPGGRNVVWVCHALTGSHRADAWWPGLVGLGRLYDPRKWCIICVNVPGSCYGSSGPLSLRPGGISPWLHGFPYLSARDVVRAFEQLANHLGYEHIHTLIGGSMGGQHALEWAYLQPERFHKLVLLATNAVHSAWGRAFDASQRHAIEADPTWGQRHPRSGQAGMQQARQLAMLSYRSYEAYALRASSPEEANSYQLHQGRKLAQRFNALSYHRLSAMLSEHDLGRGRGSLAEALGRVSTPALVIGIRQDGLFPPKEQAFLAEYLPQARLQLIDSPYGHDGFLLETEAISKLLASFYQTRHARSIPIQT